MYKGTHQNIQARADRQFIANMLPYDEKLTPEQNRENLVSALKAVEREILSLPPKHQKRKELGIKKMALQQRISAIRTKRKTSPEVKDFFISATKEIAGVALSKLIMDRAVQMMENARNEYRRTDENT